MDPPLSIINQMYIPTILITLVLGTLTNGIPPFMMAFVQNGYRYLTIYDNGILSPIFSPYSQPLTCQPQNLYIQYVTTYQSGYTSPYQILINSNFPFNISISTLYGNVPTQANVSGCNGTCFVSVTSTCPSSLTSTNYFDQVFVDVNGLKFSYFVLCNIGYLPMNFQWGLFIILVLISGLVTVMAFFSRAESVGGLSIGINIVFILIYFIMFIGGVILLYFFPGAIQDVMYGCAWILGVITISLCSSQIISFFNIEFMIKPRLSYIRLMDLFSLAVGGALTGGWWATRFNWIFNDVLAVCICIGLIKLLKFRSFKAVFMFLMMVVCAEIAWAVFLLQKANAGVYGDFVLYFFNSPFEIQLPIITKVFDTRCSWIPAAQVIFSGAILSYLRRFDFSKKTRIYLITGSISYFVGCMIYIAIASTKFKYWPLDMFTQPIIITVTLFIAFFRKELGDIWNGKFDDIEFKKKEDLETMQMVMNFQNQNQGMIEMNIITPEMRGNMRGYPYDAYGNDAYGNNTMRPVAGVPDVL